MQLISLDQEFNKIHASYYKDGVKNYKTFYDTGDNVIYDDLYIEDDKYHEVIEQIRMNRIMSGRSIDLIEHDTHHTGIKGESLRRISFPFGSAYNIKKFADGYSFHGDISYKNKFYKEYFHNNTLSNLKVSFFDIETQADKKADMLLYLEPLSVVTLTFKDIITGVKKKYVIENGDSGLECEATVFYRCKTEAELLRKIIEVVKLEKPDVISGWNSMFFDVPYIINRLEKVLGGHTPSKLSPFGKINKREVNNSFGGTEIKYTIVGLPHLDYMELYKTNVYTKRDSYKLDNITNIELGAKKMDIDKYGGFRNIWRNHFDKYVEYNIRDVDLLEQLEEKLGLIKLTAVLSYRCNTGFEHFAARTVLWDSYIYNELDKLDIIIPPFSKAEKETYAGAYVKEAKAGIYKHLASFDLNSLYPNILIQLNMSPETIIDERHSNFSNRYYDDVIVDIINDNINVDDLKDDHSISPIGVYFNNDERGILPTIVKDIYSERRETKDRMLVYKQELEDAKNELKHLLEN